MPVKYATTQTDSATEAGIDVASSAQWWEGWKDQVSIVRIQEITEHCWPWIKRILLLETSVFREQGDGTVGCILSAGGWADYTIASWIDTVTAPTVQFPYICYMLAVIEQLLYGKRWLQEVFRAASAFNTHGNDLPTHHLYGRIDDITSESPDPSGSSAGGIYSNLAPLHGTPIRVTVGGNQVTIPYDGGPPGLASAAVNRVMAGVGETRHFRHRFSAYLQDQGSTNKKTNAARLMHIAGYEVDIFAEAWKRCIVLVVPASNPDGLATQRLHRQTIETITNLLFGLTHATQRPWGLQHHFIDSITYEHKIEMDEVMAVAWKVYQDHAQRDEKGEVLRISHRTPLSDTQYWQSVLDYLISICRAGSAINYSVSSIISILNGQAWPAAAPMMPPFPQQFWGAENAVPSKRLGTSGVHNRQAALESRKRGIELSKAHPMPNLQPISPVRQASTSNSNATKELPPASPNKRRRRRRLGAGFNAVFDD